jgi:hypothetical protein
MEPVLLDYWETNEEHPPHTVKAETDKRGEWSRWGSGMCEGYSLEIGHAFRGSVVKSSTVGLPTIWIASVNATALGEFLARREAMPSGRGADRV